MNPTRRGTPDFLLLALTFCLVGFGLVMVFSASYNVSAYYHGDPLFFTKRQILWASIGTFIMLVVMNTRYEKLKKWFVPYFLVTVLLLILVLIFGVEVKGAKSWFSIGPFGGQPTEFAKIGLILYLSILISKKGEKFREFKKGLLPALIVIGFVALLIMLQPDFGSAAILMLSALIVLTAGGANLKHLFAICSAAAMPAALYIGVSLSGSASNYRMERLTSFLNPWNDPLGSGFQLIQSLFALGHGGVTGAGFGQSIQKLHYLPLAHNDFIFAIIGEELGFIGGLLFLTAYVLFLWRCLLVALRSRDISGTLVGTGVVSIIGVQALINIGGVIGAIPITGVPLPFISFGGSLLASMFALGILLSLSREYNRLEKTK